jgi:hypothetical protein
MKILFGACVAIMLAGCGSSGSGSSAPPKNLSSNGAYGFDGTGWEVMTDSTGEDVWDNGAKEMVVDVNMTGATTDPLIRTQDQEALFQSAVPGVIILFDAKLIPGTKGAVYAWNDVDKGERVYEAYYIDGPTEVDVELSGPGLSETDAMAILKTLRVL